MSFQNQHGFSVVEFLITSLSLFSGLYFVFWICFLGCNYTLAQTYLNDFSFCELRTNPSSCWPIMKRQIESLRFIEIKKLFIDISGNKKTINLIFDYPLPIVGSARGIQNVHLSSALETEAWQ